MTARDAFGTRLQNQRERLGVTLESIAQTTKINRSLLAALERADFSRWPRGIYRRSFLREYAAAIGLPPEPLLHEAAQLFPEPGQEPPPDHGVRLRLTVLPEPRWPVRGRQWLAAALDVGAIVAAAYGVSTLSGSGFWTTMAATGLSYQAAATAVLGRSPGLWCLSPSRPFARLLQPSSARVAALKRDWLADALAALQPRPQDSALKPLP
jgi:transcriptional regulator with XRE-family HTH domain